MIVPDLPMFPLGSVLFPAATMALHVFEPRYQALTRACLEGDGRLGIVLIERGSEVGGGDTRHALGTRARVTEAVALDDGRWFLALKGLDRVRIRHWLPDDPYPRAQVEVLTDDPAGAAVADARDRVERLLRRALALQTELGEIPAAPATLSLARGADAAAWQAATVAPIGPADAQRVLETDGVDQRLLLLEGLLDDAVTVLALRVGGR